MPTETDLKLAEDLADFRLASERQFGAVEKSLADFRVETANRFEKVTERFGRVDTALAGIETQLRIGRWIATFFAGVLVAVVFGAGRVVWDAATTSAEVRHQGERLDKVEKRLDAMDGKLDTIIRQTAKAGG
jgi:tetrahydromethanopterin S-methyltransferase subunit G